MLFALAQTMTSTVVTTSTTDFEALKAQLVQALVGALVLVVGALAAAVKSYITSQVEKRKAEAEKAKTADAQKLTDVAIEGVERSAATVAGTLTTFLGAEGLAALAKLGIDVEAMRKKISDAPKEAIKAVSVKAGTEPAMSVAVANVTNEPALAAEVARSTSIKMVAVDEHGNPVQPTEKKP